MTAEALAGPGGPGPARLGPSTPCPPGAALLCFEAVTSGPGREGKQMRPRPNFACCTLPPSKYQHQVSGSYLSNTLGVRIIAAWELETPCSRAVNL